MLCFDAPAPGSQLGDAPVAAFARLADVLVHAIQNLGAQLLGECLNY